MKSRLFFVSFFFIFQNCFAQVSVSSVLVNNQNQPLQFVNISVNSTVKGTYTSNSGVFSLGGLKESDTLKISSIGYKTISLLVNDISDTILLEELARDLPEVEIKAEYQYEQLGIEKSKIQLNGHGDLLGWITGIILNQVPKSYLENIEVYVKHSEQNPRNQFLLRAYDIDSVSGFPKTSLLNERVVVPPAKKGWVTIDVSDYRIPVKNTVFIGVENLPNYSYNGELALDSIGLAKSKEELVRVGVGRVKSNESLLYCWGRPQVAWQILNFDEPTFRGLEFLPMIRVTVKY